MQSPSASDANGIDHQPQILGGGAYPVFSADFLFKNHFGVGGEVAWRAHQNFYQRDLYGDFLPYRPILYDFNAVWAPPIHKRAALELQGGIGGESVRFYTGLNCSSIAGCTNYTSSNHFLGHVGAGLKLYVTESVFVRPEVHAYFVNNNFEFSGATQRRYGVSIGYTLGPRDY